jgi:ferredoxin
MKISIDVGLCTGHGRCYALTPTLFVDDERGFGQVKGDGTVAPELEHDAQRAVRSCPENAITIEQ